MAGKRSTIQREISVLEKIRDGQNIIRLQAIVKNLVLRRPALIFDYVNAADFKQLYKSFNNQEIRFYLQELLKALEYCHTRGIMHRDIKPSNVVYDHENRKLRLIDFGQAHYYKVDKKYTVNVGTRPFKSPELLLDYQTYNQSVDIWSYGCVAAGLIFRKHPFFDGRDTCNQLTKIAKVLGTKDLRKYVKVYQMSSKNVFGRYLKKRWDRYIDKNSVDLASPQALDLIDQLLRYDHKTRLTATFAMDHPYFKPVLGQQRQQANISVSAPPIQVPAMAQLDQDPVSEGFDVNEIN